MSNGLTHELIGLLGCAARLGVPAKWLREKALAGELPCLRIGKRKLLFDAASVEAALLRIAATEPKAAGQTDSYEGQ